MAASTPRATIYCRVSTDHQERNTSLASQEEACRQFAREHGYLVAEEHVHREIHSGAELWERPHLTRVRETIKAGEVDALIAYAVDRLSREQAHLYILDDECDRAGADLLFVTEQFDKTPVGKMIRSVKGFAAELEREKIRERMMRGMQSRIQSGKLPGTARPVYGYRYADETRAALVPDPDTAAVVRRIFALAAEGNPIVRITALLNAEGIPAPRYGREWQRSSVGAILRQPAYIGQALAHQTQGERKNGRKRRVARPVEERVALPAGIIPPLIDLETFEVVRQRLTRNKAESKRRSVDPERFLLRAGYAVCGICGRTLVSKASHNRSSNVHPIYVADSTRHGGCVPGKRGFSISATDLDADIRAEVARRLLDPSIIAAEVAGQNSNADPIAESLATVDRMLDEIRRKQGNLTAALALVDDEDARTPLVVELKTLGERRRALLTERAGLEAQSQEWRVGQEQVRSLADWCRTAAENLAGFTYENWRTALLALGVRVHVFPAGRQPRRWEIYTVLDKATSLVSSSP
ncbi:MAG: recombinase family protein [Chloroflexota bacterium]|nr:recombinase family protein [Chloroflexota bacterium]